MTKTTTAIKPKEDKLWRFVPVGIAAIGSLINLGLSLQSYGADEGASQSASNTTVVIVIVTLVLCIVGIAKARGSWKVLSGLGLLISVIPWGVFVLWDIAVLISPP